MDEATKMCGGKLSRIQLPYIYANYIFIIYEWEIVVIAIANVLKDEKGSCTCKKGLLKQV